MSNDQNKLENHQLIEGVVHVLNLEIRSLEFIWNLGFRACNFYRFD